MIINEAFPSKYLAKEDFTQPRSVIIDTVALENVAMDNQPPEMKPVIFYKGAPKGMILNKTCANILEALFGPETDAWSGQRIEVYNDITVQYQGKLTGGLRVRPVQPIPQGTPEQPYVPPAPRQAPPVPVQAHADTNGIAPTDNPGQPADFDDDIPGW